MEENPLNPPIKTSVPRRTRVRKWQARALRKWHHRLHRLFHFKLVVPLFRHHRDPRITARGMALGLGCALTPLLGVQMLMVGAIWALVKLVKPDFKINLIVALAWTWVTNVFTVPLVYYVFLLTGNLMLGRGLNGVEFSEFSSRLAAMLDGKDVSFIESLWVYTEAIFAVWGIPLFIGCIPWLIGVSWFGYYWCYKLLNSFHHRGGN